MVTVRASGNAPQLEKGDVYLYNPAMTGQAMVSQIVVARGNCWWQHLVAWGSGVLLLSLLAQVYVVLPFTPVPVTGQTLGVGLIALFWGRKQAVAIVASYLLLGAMGLPVFAMAKSGLSWGPTFGYLLGMLAASYVMGSLADRGWTNSFVKTYLALALGSFVTFAVGVLGLSFFLPGELLLVSGVLPFLPGDLLKSLLAALSVRLVYGRNSMAQ